MRRVYIVYVTHKGRDYRYTIEAHSYDYKAYIGDMCLNHGLLSFDEALAWLKVHIQSTYDISTITIGGERVLTMEEYCPINLVTEILSI